ncbi:hypothetical protein OIB37_01205 [Streptomyces sp. NBC_00820]|uniref:hypothetical protein n=1 Tax=Streptomyces sp. NBC_00820 TaxID=2975842 RepID=UPI002ED43BE8|nr:hypothetical protein OIB37_01205 [Streptomyces sp. NBC_00820]
MRSYAAASLATVVPPALGLYEDASGLFGVSWGLGALVVFTALFSVKQARKGAETGRVAAIRDEGLATGEYTLTQYKVFLPDDRPKSSPEREESPLTLRTTNLGLQHWDNDVLRWSHPWAGLRLVVEDELLFVHHEGQLIARFWVFTPFGAIDEILLAADRLQRHRSHR